MDQARRALLEAHTSLNNMQLDIQRSIIELEREEVLLRHSEIRAPITGTVMVIEAREGAILGTSETAPVVLQMADLSLMTVEARITEADIAQFSAAQECYFTTLGNCSRRWDANLTRIDPTGRTGRDGIAFVARFDVVASGGELFPGMTAQVNCVGARADNVLTVPVSALSFPDAPDNTSRAIVRLMLADGTVENREIVLGARDRANAEVISGLAAGDRVIAGLL
jgi:macrolide-specific efflux system membrane fusion protein